MAESSREKKAAALKLIQAGELNAKELKQALQGPVIRFVSLDAFEEWLKVNHAGVAEEVIADVIAADGKEENMPTRTLTLILALDEHTESIFDL